MLNGILWVPCSGASWRGTFERYGRLPVVYQNFRDGRSSGTFDQVLKRLHVRLKQQSLIEAPM